jgi:hypothetical protein
MADLNTRCDKVVIETHSKPRNWKTVPRRSEFQYDLLSPSPKANWGLS